METEYDVLSKSIELLIDQLHLLTERGDIEDAIALADRIRELQLMKA